METLYIVMPAYNEEANIEKVIEQWYPVLNLGGYSEANRMVIADSGSTDSTHEILLSLQTRFPALEILSDTKKQHGPKVIALYDHAVREGAGYVFQTDSDGQTDPKEFYGFWEERHQYDAVLGWRYKRGDGRIRDVVEHVVCFLLRLIFHVNVPDANAPYRLMNAELLKKYLYRLPSGYNLPNIMLTTYFSYYHENIVFKKISFRPRQGGTNSVNILEIIKIGWKAVRDFLVFRREMQEGI